MKIKIKSTGFLTTHYGYLEPEKEYEVSEGFAGYCVNRMKAADFVETPKKKRSIRKRIVKDDANNGTS